MPPTVDTQGLDTVHSKRPKTGGSTDIENVVYSPESPGRRHSHISRPTQRYMALPGIAIDAFVTDDDYQHLRIEHNISEESLKSAWEVCRRLDPFDVFDSYSHDDLRTIFSIFQCETARQLFRKIHQEAGSGHGHEATEIERDSGFYSVPSARSSRTTNKSRQSGFSPADELTKRHPETSTNPYSHHTRSSGAAVHLNDLKLFTPNGDLESINAHSDSNIDATAPTLPFRGPGNLPEYLPLGQTASTTDLRHSSGSTAQMHITADVNRRDSATVPVVLQATLASEMTPSLENASSQAQETAATGDESSDQVQRVVYECTHCTKTFQKPGHRTKHHEQKHDALYIYECKQCRSTPKQCDSYTSIRRHLKQEHELDEDLPEYRYPERRQCRPPNNAMACGLCGELFKRSDWAAKATFSDKTPRAARSAGSTRTPKAIAFQQRKQDDRMNQDFLESVWYDHITTVHHSDLSNWSRRIVTDAFLRRDELRPLLEFAILSAPTRWNEVLDQRIENDPLWDKILEQLEFYSLSGNTGEAKKTIELCLGLDGFDWTPFDWWSNPRTRARNYAAPPTSSRSSTPTQVISPGLTESSYMPPDSGHDTSTPVISPWPENFESLFLDIDETYMNEDETDLNQGTLGINDNAADVGAWLSDSSA